MILRSSNIFPDLKIKFVMSSKDEALLSAHILNPAFPMLEDLGSQIYKSQPLYIICKIIENKAYGLPEPVIFVRV